MYSKNCPKCNKQQVYTSKLGYTNATKANSQCKECASTAKAKRNADLSILLEDTPQVYYWIGFILADGHIANNARLRITLQAGDSLHLMKFADLIEGWVVIKEDICALSSMNKEVVQQLSSKFDIKEQKTYNPPNITIKDKDLLLSLIIGFIDGDGHIQQQYKREDCVLALKAHSSWIDFYNYISETLLSRKQAYINKEGYVCLHCGHKILVHLKETATKLQLPILERKWNKIKI